MTGLWNGWDGVRRSMAVLGGTPFRLIRAIDRNMRRDVARFESLHEIEQKLRQAPIMIRRRERRSLSNLTLGGAWGMSRRWQDHCGSP
jgi:hypothetical protein